MPIFSKGIGRGKQSSEAARIAAEEFGSSIEVHGVPWKGWELKEWNRHSGWGCTIPSDVMIQSQHCDTV